MPAEIVSAMICAPANAGFLKSAMSNIASRLLQLRDDERGEQDDRGGEEPDRPAAAPAPVAAAQQREDERKETSGQEHEAEQVEAAMLLVARLVQVGERAEDAERADRQVDEEDPPPAGVLGEEAADERADRDGEPDRRAPDPERGAALAPVELLREDRERDREHRPRRRCPGGRGRG